MHLQPVITGDPGQRLDLLRPVDPARFGHLAQAQGRRPDMMRAQRTDTGQRRCECGRVDLGARPVDTDNLGAARIHLRRTAFIHIDMRLVMAQHRAPGRRDGRKGKRIGRRAQRHQRDMHVALKEGREHLRHFGGERIAAIGADLPRIRRGDRIENGRRDTGCVVGPKVHADPRMAAGWTFGLSMPAQHMQRKKRAFDTAIDRRGPTVPVCRICHGAGVTRGDNR